MTCCANRIASLPALNIALHDLEALLLLDQPAATAAATKKKPGVEPYNRSRYQRYARDPTKSFNELYMFCFNMAKPSCVPFLPLCRIFLIPVSQRSAKH